MAKTKITEQYEAIRAEIVNLLESAKSSAARNVNSIMTAVYWEIGRRIVESGQRGRRRADYGERLIERLSADLTKNLAADLERSISGECVRSSKLGLKSKFFQR